MEFTKRHRISLSFVMPVHNEELNIGLAVKKADRICSAITKDYEIVVVNDGSTDKTSVKLSRLGRAFRKLNTINHNMNRGYGAAISTGVNAATKAYVFYTDADNQFDLQVLPGAVRMLKQVDMVIGYRLHRQDAWHRLWVSQIYKLLMGVIFGIWVKDVNCSFKLFPGQLFKSNPLQSKTILIDAEMIMKARMKKLSIAEIGVPHFARIKGTSNFETHNRGVFKFIKPMVIWEILREVKQYYFTFNNFSARRK